ncbi:MAG: RNA polymerase sigma factor [Anaerolineae bacterium]|jgi:RNA polymerase sigma-70 factor (ECF subfamily)
MDSETALVDSARAGDRDAFEQLVEAYSKPVYNLAFRMLGNGRDAEDASQEAFLRAYRALGSYDRSRPFSTWLLSITAHHCIDRLRRRKGNEISLDGLPTWRWVPAATIDPERSAERADQADRVRQLLDDLPESYRLVVVLRYWHDLGYSEIASVIGESESAVKSRLHRARRQLAAALAEADGAIDRDGERAPVPAGGNSQCNAILPAS